MSTYQPYPPTQTPGYYPQPEQPQYPVMPYPQFVGRPEHPQASTVLVLGILGLVLAGVLGPVAWYMGNKAMKECATGMYVATDQLKAGRILGIIGTVFLIIEVAVVIFTLIMVFAVWQTANY